MSRRRALALGAASAWTLVVWASRIGLLTPEEAGSPRTWFRVGLGIAFGLALGWTAIRARRAARSGGGLDRLDGWLLFAFALWSVLIWVPDVIDLFVDERDLGFVIVHLVLAVGSLAFGLLAARIAQGLLAREAPGPGRSL